MLAPAPTNIYTLPCTLSVRTPSAAPAGAWADSAADTVNTAATPNTAAHPSFIVVAPLVSRILPQSLLRRFRRRRHRRQLHDVLGVHRLGAAARRLERQV